MYGGPTLYRTGDLGNVLFMPLTLFYRNENILMEKYLTVFSRDFTKICIFAVDYMVDFCLSP